PQVGPLQWGWIISRRNNAGDRMRCWCESAANAPLGRRSKRVSPRLPHHQLGGPGQAQAMQLLDYSDGPLACRRDVLAGVDRLKHGRDLPHLGRGHVAEDIAVPVHDAPLPGGLWKELCGALGKPNAGIRGDQPDTLQPAFLEMLEERAPASLIFLRPLAN